MLLLKYLDVSIIVTNEKVIPSKVDIVSNKKTKKKGG